MRIVELAPGVGETFYCENCLRDRALTRALRRAGQDASVVPLYLPIVTDEPGDSRDSPIFFGGLNLYLQEKFSLMRILPRAIRRFLDSPALLRWAARHAGMTTAEDMAKTTLSMLMGEQGRQRRELDRLADWLWANERPDVVVLSNALLIGLARRIRHVLRCPVICLLQDEDVFLDELPAVRRKMADDIIAERAADVDAFIAVSGYYRDYCIQRFRLDEEKVHVVYSGVPLEEYQPSSPPDRPVIGYLERLCPDKGLDLLIDAFILLKNRPATKHTILRITGGQLPSDERFVAGLHQRLDDWHVSEDVQWLPNLRRPERLEFLRGLSALSVPARHPEAFGLYVLEALASGVPVVEPDQGSFRELLEMTGGGLLCKTNDAHSLADQLETVLVGGDGLAIGRRGRAVVMERFGVDRMAEQVLGICTKVVAEAAQRV